RNTDRSGYQFWEQLPLIQYAGLRLDVQVNLVWGYSVGQGDHSHRIVQDVSCEVGSIPLGPKEGRYGDRDAVGAVVCCNDTRKISPTYSISTLLQNYHHVRNGCRSFDRYRAYPKDSAAIVGNLRGGLADVHRVPCPPE